MNRIPLTVAGAERLRQELKDLKYVKRPLVIEAIAVARDHGDLKENADDMFPRYIAFHLPVGVSGLVGAAMFADENWKKRLRTSAQSVQLGTGD